MLEDDNTRTVTSINADEGQDDEEEEGCENEVEDIEWNMQRTAVEELLNLSKANGGKKKRGDIKLICKSYNKEGYSYVTRRSIEHILSKMKKKGKSLSSVLDGEGPPLMSVTGNFY